MTVGDRLRKRGIRGGHAQPMEMKDSRRPLRFRLI